MNYKNLALILNSVLLFLSAFSNPQYKNINATRLGEILYRESPYWGSYTLKLLTEDGDELTIGRITGSPGWSSDGRLLAVGCPSPDIQHICIINSSAIPYLRYNPSAPITSAPLFVKKLELPADCVLSFLSLESIEIQSIAWSPNGEKLVVVCSDTLKTSKICILNAFNNQSVCWSSFQNGIARALWNPSGDKIIIAYGERWINPPIFEVSLDGKNSTEIARGWSPAVSPDGSKLAFLNGYKEAGTEKRSPLPGIAILDFATKQQEWAYTPPALKDVEYLSFGIICGEVRNETCRLSWSPDGKSIIFSAKLLDGYVWMIYRLDISTKKITTLINGHSKALSEPVLKP
jgi:WD40 repeat protein